MDIKGLTANLLGKIQVEDNVIKPSVASGDNAAHANNLPLPQTIKALQAMLQTLQLSKIFDVIVIRVEGSVVTLQVPGSPAGAPVLQAELKSPPPLGTRLTLQLIETTHQTERPELKVIATPNSPQDAVSRNLRVVMQQQQAMTPLLANLALLAKNTNKTQAVLPEEVTAAIRQVVQQFPHSVQIKDAQGLKQALQQTGPYLDSMLAKQTLPADIKSSTQTPNPQMASLSAGKISTDSVNSEISKQARLEISTQSIEVMSKAMQQQPLQDVRGNLLRLATIIRAVSELNSLQKNASTVADELANKTASQMNRQTDSPLPADTLKSKLSASYDSLIPASTTKPATNYAPQAMPSGLNQIRSQTPQPQAMAQATLAGILNPESALKELLGQVEGSLARIQVQQLQTAATEQQNKPVWVMELPVRTDQGIDLFDLRIQRDTEDHAEGDPKAPWTVMLAFDLEKLGAIRAQITLYGEDKISTVFWAEQQATSTYFNQHMNRLENQLKRVGLDVARLDCRCGKPESPPPSQEPRLVDEKV